MRLRLRSFAPILLLAGTTITCWAVEAAGLRLNLTPSVPIGLYRLSKSPVGLGDLVAACLPESFGTLGRKRGYLRQGSCPAGASPIIKHVVAASGSCVEIKPDGVFVDGQHIQSPAPAIDSKGRTLYPLSAGSYVLSPGQIWLFSPRENSWDSRFFGPVQSSMVLGQVKPLWIFDPAQPDSLQ